MKLDVLSSIDSRKYPQLYQWDSNYRFNHELYQQKIDELTFHLQKSARGFTIFGSWTYPLFFQKDLLLLELLKKKQVLGQITPEEVNDYKSLNNNIATDLNKAFNARLIIPWNGLIVGSGLFAFAHIFNYQYSFRTGLFLLPILADLATQWCNKTSQMRSIEFMDFLTQVRKGRCRLEYERDSLDQRLLKKMREVWKMKKPLEDYYEQVVNLARQDREEWKD